MSIPKEIAARVLFFANRTCCVCRDESKGIEIHHIDGENANHDPANLAVLCRDCHDDATVSGGLLRKLDTRQIVKYRDEWNVLAGQIRSGGVPISREFTQIDSFFGHANKCGARMLGVKHMREKVPTSSPTYYGHFAVITAQIGTETCYYKKFLFHEYPEKWCDFRPEIEIANVKSQIVEKGFEVFEGA
jgi:hypothetical protein